MKTKCKDDRDCGFFSALLGTVILLCFLFILGVPKFVIALEYWSKCPSFPLIPVYLCVTGLLGVACVAHSAFLWSCLYRRRMMNRKSHDCCLVLWVLLMLTVSITQLIGAPFIIYKYHTSSYNTTGCDVMDKTTSSPSSFNQSATSFPGAVYNISIHSNDTEEDEYISNPAVSAKSGKTLPTRTRRECYYCSDIVITCAYITAFFEVVFLAGPILGLVTASVVYRIRNRKTLERK